MFTSSSAEDLSWRMSLTERQGRESILLEEQEFNDFVKNHPVILENLRAEKGIEKLVRVTE